MWSGKAPDEKVVEECQLGGTSEHPGEENTNVSRGTHPKSSLQESTVNISSPSKLKTHGQINHHRGKK